jgi:hypothetical protein
MPYEMSFSIRVVDEDGNPRVDVPVSAHTSLDYSKGRTDSDGWVELDFYFLTGSFRVFQIYVDGDDMSEHSIEDGDRLSFTA